MNKRHTVIAIVALLVGIGLGVLLGKAEPAVAPSPSETTSEVALSHTFMFVVENGSLRGDKRPRANEGDRIILQIISDRADEFHLHGYDKSVELSAFATATLEFDANIAGRFPFELERSHAELGAIEISPN